MADKGKLGALNKIKKGITAVSEEASYADPASKHLGDWPWKPLKEVTTKLEVKEVPDYVQKGYGDFMKWQAARAGTGDLGKRDLAKAFGITQSSIGRGGLPHASATKAGLKVPNTGELVRPEGAFAEWLGSKMGQRYLNAAERGEIDPEAIADIQAKFSPFGKPNQLAEQLSYGASDLVQRPEDIAAIVSGDKEAFRDFAQSIKGINQAKAGFIGSLLGRGDLPTLDARQLNLHTLPPEGVKVESVMKRGKHAGAREAVDRLIARQEAMGVDLDPSLDPFYQHLTHHAVWDKAANSKTTHDDLVRAMRGYGKGGKVGALNKIATAIGNASDEAKGMSLADRDAAKAAFMAKSKDPRRFYHGTARDVKELKTGAQRHPGREEHIVTHAAFVTPDTKLADQFARVNPDMFNHMDTYAPNIMPVRVHVENPFDFEDPRHIGGLGRHIEDRMFDDEYKAGRNIDTHGYNDDELAQVDALHDQIRRAAKDPENYKFFEQPHIRDALEALGYDSFYVNEQGIKNLGVFDPKRIKSDIGNRGTYDITEGDMTKAHGGLVHLAKGGGKLGAVKRMGRAISDVSNEADQMTPAAGGLRFADTPRGGPSIIKEKGGNWLSGSVEQAVKPLKPNDLPSAEDKAWVARHKAEWSAHPDSDKKTRALQAIQNDITAHAKSEALGNWVERNLTNYVKNQMATADDPVRRLAEEGIVHIPTAQVGVNRYKAPESRRMYGGEQMGKSEAAQAWEDASDVAIYPGTVGEIKRVKELGGPGANKYEPWMEKVDPKTQISRTTGNFNAQDLGFDHIVDVLKEDLAAGRIRPEQLNKISMEQAVRRVHAYDQQKAKEMAEAQIKATEGMPVHKEYPEGYKWLELKMNKELPEGWREMEGNPGVYIDPEGKKTIHSPNKLALEDALDYEGKTMGHCVGGYCPDVISGKSRIYSLRDAKGEPHVTVETKPGVHPISTSRRGDNFPDISEMEYAGKYSFGSPYKPTSEQLEQIQNKAYELWSSKGTGRARDIDYFYQKAANEILGPMPESIVQIKGKQNAAPKEAYLPFVHDFVKGGEWSDVGDIHNTGLIEAKHWLNPTTHEKYLEHGLTVPKYATEKELDALHNEYYRLAEPRNYKPPEGMRDGGAVNPGQYDYGDGGGVPQDPMGAPSYTVDPQDREHLKRMVAIAKEHLAETNRKIRKNGVADMIRHSLVAPAIGGASDMLNLPLEIADYAQSKVPALSEPESVLAMYDRKQTSPHVKTEWDRVPKRPLASEQPFMGTSDVRERMAKYGVTTGDEYPFYDQFGEFVVDPFIGYKALKAGYKGAKKAHGALHTLKP